MNLTSQKVIVEKHELLFIHVAHSISVKKMVSPFFSPVEIQIQNQYTSITFSSRLYE